MPAGLFYRMSSIVFALSSLPLLVACGSAERSLSQGEARQIAEASVLRSGDLPRASWTVSEDESWVGSGNDSDSLFFDDDERFATSECQELIGRIEDVDFRSGEGASLAGASTSFDSQAGTLSARQVSSLIAVFPNRSAALSADEVVRSIFSADGARPCFESAFRGLEEDGFAITRISVVDSTDTLAGAQALALQVEGLAIFIPVNVLLELHAWSREEVLSVLMTLEVNSDLLQSNRLQLLERADTKIAKALERE